MLTLARQVILCDFDGTISAFDVTNTLCRLHIPKRWAELEQAWLAREISATECYEQEYEALGLRKEEIDAFLEQVPLAEGFFELLEVAKELGWEFHILSAGFDYYIERLLGRHGLRLPYTANRLSFDAAGKPVFAFLQNYDLQCGRYKAPCAGCKPATWREWKGRGYRVAYIGDGTTDFCLADAFAAERGEGDLLFAKETLLRYCQEKRIPVHPYRSLADVAEHLRQLAAQEMLPPAPACRP
jgi:2-hydroxy-3-keto-5-methylthiopentenyl-1-phosphate phosphatase